MDLSREKKKKEGRKAGRQGEKCWDYGNFLGAVAHVGMYFLLMQQVFSLSLFLVSNLSHTLVSNPNKNIIG